MNGVRQVSRWTDAADVVRRVVAEATAADGNAPVDEAVELRLANHGLDRAALWLAGGDAFALVRHRDDRADATLDLDLVTRPEARSRGLGGELAATALESGPGPWAAWSHGDHPAARRLAERHGFVASRELWVMRRAGGLDLPPARVPEGVTLRDFRPEDADGVVAVNAAAFADHPEQGAMDRAGFEERAAQEWFDPEGLVVAERDGAVVGFHWTKAHPVAEGAATSGEVYVIGVAPQLQGSGLGQALLVAGVEHLHARGVDEVLLYVESDNPAVRLYERLGFTHQAEDTHVQFTRG